MSVYVKGMEMPQRCDECILVSGGECIFLGIDAEMDSIDMNCPLVEVPTPHGRLIDMDAFDKDLALNVHNKRKTMSYPTVVSNTILKTPTIIEAEEQKKMWESPIEIICNDIQEQIVEEHESLIVKAVQSYGVNVDKEQLVKALMYDRQQYEKGYADAKAEQSWIPCSEGLPENNNPVNITWTNREPAPYYARIKDVPFVATGHYHNGKWWWHSATCQDYLDEYGESEVDRVEDGIEILAWMPLPAPYTADMRGEEDERA